MNIVSVWEGAYGVRLKIFFHISDRRILAEVGWEEDTKDIQRGKETDDTKRKTNCDVSGRG